VVRAKFHAVDPEQSVDLGFPGAHRMRAANLDDKEQPIARTKLQIRPDGRVFGKSFFPNAVADARPHGGQKLDRCMSPQSVEGPNTHRQPRFEALLENVDAG
jgi:hypothetical protein